MYVAVLVVILGQSLLFESWRLLAYAALAASAFHIFVVGYEEPKLRRTFGPEYASFCANVPRWIPCWADS